MSIKLNYEDDHIVSIVLNGDEYWAECGETIIVPMTAFKGHLINELPLNISIDLCDSCGGNVVMLHNLPTQITQVSHGVFRVDFDETTTRKYWDAPIGLKLWMETKRDIVAEREKMLGDVKVENFDDDGAYIHFSYSGIVNSSSFEELFLLIDTLYNEIDGATDLALGSPFEKIENCKKESDFSTKILLPLFRNLGFSNVKYNHGNQEYGKDITLARRTEFDEYEFYGVQVKFGDISGKANGEIDILTAQVKNAFSVPFYDVYTRNRVWISKVIIAISGKFTSNAIIKIVDGIHDFPMKNNLIFLDGDKLNTLFERYRRF